MHPAATTRRSKRKKKRMKKSGTRKERMVEKERGWQKGWRIMMVLSFMHHSLTLVSEHDGKCLSLRSLSPPSLSRVEQLGCNDWDRRERRENVQTCKRATQHAERDSGDAGAAATLYC